MWPVIWLDWIAAILTGLRWYFIAVLLCNDYIIIIWSSLFSFVSAFLISLIKLILWLTFSTDKGRQKTCRGGGTIGFCFVSIPSAKALFPNKVTFWGSEWTWIWRDTIQTTIMTVHPRGPLNVQAGVSGFPSAQVTSGGTDGGRKKGWCWGTGFCESLWIRPMWCEKTPHKVQDCQDCCLASDSSGCIFP